MKDNEIISAFAFDLGQQIEDLINDKIGEVKNRNRILEAKILKYYVENKDEKFAEYFNINTHYTGL